jgi:thiamine-phosphate pyrophosphorylase
MFKMICVTNRGLAADFSEQIGKVAAAKPDIVILREKDLSERDYSLLAADVLVLCRNNGVKCFFHTFIEVAKEQNADGIHLSLPMLREFHGAAKASFNEIGCSVHSVAEAKEAWFLGATYVTAGHIFPTDCKKGVAPRGPEFLRQVCESVPIPVYAIGGVNAANATLCMEAGAAGLCMMSELMKRDDPEALIQTMRGRRLFPPEENGQDLSLAEMGSFDKDSYLIVDIRGSVPFHLGKIAGSINIPFPEEAARIYEIPRGKPVIVCCQKGEISREIVEILVDAGYEAYNLKEGYLGWLMKEAKE